MKLIKEKATRLALKELKNLLMGRPKRYEYALKAIAKGRRSCSEVKRYVEEREATRSRAVSCKTYWKTWRG
ncbi:MAG: hypothetical protein NZ934_05070 [Hadesarchaea archaeon]|nr:hypothetical protein [Hadesarchaea archaeon]